jgi:hypothetical protein
VVGAASTEKKAAMQATAIAIGVRIISYYLIKIKESINESIKAK